MAYGYGFGKPSKKSKKTNNVKWDNSKTFVNVKQGASAKINQGGNAFAINASDIGVVRVRPGQEG
ncbi:hypothetical protein KP806_21845 [Paenibacillus sp. N4]|uniref:hypothetical protein n=1 Tax=Paenibacillus vietnamensis TaxID=2590547 RepID=UPI001CD170CF|nr:hypothetical protein [Paenibacillus vietnamensis]MCA0757710.1 hypothetical protein [Paenibacillus vietnamensis]